MFDAINQYLFALINAPGIANTFPSFALWVAADWLIIGLAVLMLIGWIIAEKHQQRALFNAGLSAIFGLLISYAIQTIWPHPLPAAMGFGQQVFKHTGDASFPSDHGTVMFSVALALLLSKSRFGYLALLAALITAWARILLGHHWPFDMLAALLVAFFAALVVCTLLPRRLTWVFESVLAVYNWLKKPFRAIASKFRR